MMKIRASIVIGLTMSLPLTAIADFREEGSACREIDSDSARLACYDRLFVDVPDEAGLGTDDDLGIESVADKNKKKKKKRQREKRTVSIESCETGDNSRRVYFHLDNGQVWRQKNTGYFPTEKCRSEAVLSKDMFGYSLNVKAADWKVRVTQVR